MRLFCWFGRHFWVYHVVPTKCSLAMTRECQFCPKLQKQTPEGWVDGIA